MSFLNDLYLKYAFVTSEFLINAGLIITGIGIAGLIINYIILKKRNKYEKRQ